MLVPSVQMLTDATQAGFPQLVALSTSAGLYVDHKRVVFVLKSTYASCTYYIVLQLGKEDSKEKVII